MATAGECNLGVPDGRLRVVPVGYPETPTSPRTFTWGLSLWVSAAAVEHGTRVTGVYPLRSRPSALPVVRSHSVQLVPIGTLAMSQVI